jgi:hypothetical protein
MTLGSIASGMSCDPESRDLLLTIRVLASTLLKWGIGEQNLSLG